MSAADSIALAPSSPLSLPSGAPDCPLRPLRVRLVVRTRGEMTETEERQVELGSSETPKPHKKPTLAGMEDVGRLKENRDPIQSIKANLLRGSFEEAWGSGRGGRRKGRCHPLT